MKAVTQLIHGQCTALMHMSGTVLRGLVQKTGEEACSRCCRAGMSSTCTLQPSCRQLTQLPDAGRTLQKTRTCIRLCVLAVLCCA